MHLPNCIHLFIKHAFIVLAFLCYKLNYAQQVVVVFKALRFTEDYSYLRKDSTKSWYRKIKYTAPSKDSADYISFGGELRYQYFIVKNEDWGEAPQDNDGYVLSRFLWHTDAHLLKQSRVFVQLQGSVTNGKISGTSAVDENPLDLHQAFLDISNTQGKLTLRFGRQELSYGSQRLISVRELPNNRQSFDAAKIIVTSKSHQLDLFYSHYVSAEKGIFDDKSNGKIRLWGGYWVHNKIPLIQNVDAYYLGLSKDLARFNDGYGSELRHTVGARIWDIQKKWRYDIEGIYQLGKFAGKQITAWTTSVNVGRKLNLIRLHSEVGLKTEIISGDKGKDDKRLQTFNPLFPRGAYFGLSALIGPSNLFDIHPSITFELCKGLFWTIDYDVFWRYSCADGIYASNVVLLYPSGNVSEKFIGQQTATDIAYTPNPFLYFRTEFTWFKSGCYLKKVSLGKDILFLGLTAQLKF